MDIVIMYLENFQAILLLKFPIKKKKIIFLNQMIL